MSERVFEKSIKVPVDVRRLWDWHMRPGAFERLAPPWQRIVPDELPDPPRDGSRASFRIKSGPLSLQWVARIGPVEPPYRFVDTQEKGPFGSWRHKHIMEESGHSESVLTDSVRYSLPSIAGMLPFARSQADKELKRLFAFRHQRMAQDLERFGGKRPGDGRIVLVSGSSGLIGSRLVPFLRTLGYTVRGLTRGPAGTDRFHWDPDAGRMDPDALKGVHAVIHLAGENIAGGRWTTERRKRIRLSRVLGTRTLVEAMLREEASPSVLVTASGVNYYGSGPGEKAESAPSGDGFLAEVCREWESEAARVANHGIRCVRMRTGIVLDPSGGVLGKLLPVFKLGGGGPVGSGRQAFPWIPMDDLLDIYELALRDGSIDGPVNAVHPETVSQKDFSRILGSVLRRPAVLPVPAFAVKAAFGQMGEETLLADLPVVPRVLESTGHVFRFGNLEESLAFMLGRPVS